MYVYNNLRSSRFYQAFSLAALAVICLIYPSLALAAEPESCAKHAFCFPSISPELKALILSAAAGAFGGLLYAVKEGSVVALPRGQDGDQYRMGYVADLLYGIGGGIVIFLLYPGDIELLSKGGGMLKFLGLGIVGGYGGRVVLEKALNARISGLEEKVSSLDNKETLSAKAKAMVDRVLDENPEGEQDEAKLKQLLDGASYSIQVDAFMRARAFRQEMDKKLFESKRTDGKSARQARQGLSQSIKVLTALAEIDTENKYHRTHGQLAYAYRNLGDYEKAEKAFTQAITVRNAHDVKGYRVYEFGRAACRAMLQPDDRKKILDDLAQAVEAKGDAKERLNPLSPEYEPELSAWFEKHPDERANFITQHGIDPLPDDPVT